MARQSIYGLSEAGSQGFSACIESNMVLVKKIKSKLVIYFVLRGMLTE